MVALFLAAQEPAHRTVILREERASVLLRHLQEWDKEERKLPRWESAGSPTSWSQVTATADDEASTVTLSGPEKAVEETAASLETYDRPTRPLTVRVRFLETSKQLDSTISIKATEFAESRKQSGDLVFTLRPLMARDDTVIGIVEIDYERKRIRSAFRIRNGSTVVFFPTKQEEYKGGLTDSDFPTNYDPWETDSSRPWPADWAIGVSIKGQ